MLSLQNILTSKYGYTKSEIKQLDEMFSTTVEDGSTPKSFDYEEFVQVFMSDIDQKKKS